jgi:hypothetical protein
MESNIEMAEKHLALQKEYNLTLKDAIATELKYSELKKKYDNLNKEFAAKQCELLREIGECNSLTKERDAIKARCDKMEAALKEIARQKTCEETENDPDGILGSDGKKMGDIEVGYDCCIEEARKALNRTDGHNIPDKGAMLHEGINEKEGDDE